MSELTLDSFGKTYTFGDDVSMEEAIAEVRGKFNPKYAGTNLERLFNSNLNLFSTFFIF